MNRDHWFWKYAYENKGVYAQGGIATLMVNLFALVIGFFVWYLDACLVVGCLSSG